MGKKSGSGSGIRIRDGNPEQISERLRNHFFWLKYLNSLMQIRDPGSGMKKIRIQDQGSRMKKIWIKDLGTGMEKIWIRDLGSEINIPGSAKLDISLPNLLGLKEPSNNRTLCGKGILGRDQVIFTI
jgi:hypothetical protein